MKINNKGHSTTQVALEWAIAIVIIAIILITILFLMDKALDASEQTQCYRLQQQADQYKNFLYSQENQGGFYITELEKQMCDHHGIVVEAPIRLK